ncbi:UNVERIFIED_CONTAM: ferredoxin, partial [Prevotella sp. 15_C9]
ITHCHKDALYYGAAKGMKSEKNMGTEGQGVKNEVPDTSRRNFLLATAAVASTAALAQEKKKVDGGLAAVTQKEPFKRHTPITPPGS